MDGSDELMKDVGYVRSKELVSLEEYFEEMNIVGNVYWYKLKYFFLFISVYCSLLLQSLVCGLKSINLLQLPDQAEKLNSAH